MAKKQRKEFPLEKILTISAEGYFGNRILEPEGSSSGYTPVGVHVAGFGWNESPVEALSKKVPENTEVVVGYQETVFASERLDIETGVRYPTCRYAAHGTALVPKRK